MAVPLAVHDGEDVVAIRDLLWACPACRSVESLVRSGRAEQCASCGARLRRGRGANIVLEVPGRTPVARHAREWADLIGDPQDGEEDVSARVSLRDVARSWPLRERGELLGFVERFGPDIPGLLILTRDAIRFQPDTGPTRVWPILDVTAVQPASSKLQLKVRGSEVVTLRFVSGSVRLWEARIQQRLREAWRAAGWGEIVEFQPRVSAR